jgi:hypothetical protein
VTQQKAVAKRRPMMPLNDRSGSPSLAFGSPGTIWQCCSPGPKPDFQRMFELLGIPPQALFGQLLLGLINGSFYAILSLGLAVIFGLLNIINFTHGAQYMMGAFVAWMLLNYSGSAIGGR